MSEEELENLLSVVIEDTTIESERLRQYIKDLRTELNSLKEIEQLHKEENGKLRVELEKKQNKIQALEKQHDYDMQMIDEVKGNAVKWANELEQEKEKNRTLEELLQGRLFELYKYYKDLASKYQGNCISKDKIKEKIEELVKQGDYRTAENPNGRVHFHKEPVDYQLEILKELLKEV